MKEILTYILGVVVCGGLFTAFYRTALHRHSPFRTARIFLIGIPVVSAVIPALDIPVWRSVPIEIAYTIPTIALPGSPAGTTPVNWPEVALWNIYALGITILAGVMIRQAVKIGRIRRRAEMFRAEGHEIALSDEVSAPFAFLSTVFLKRGTSPEDMRRIITHEMSHVRHRHPAEKIVMEALKSLMWFNPFVWWVSRLLAEVHEFEADRDVLEGGCSVGEYLPVIFRQVFGYVPEISVGLGNSLTKKRFEMLTQKMKHHRYGWLRAAGVLPLAAGMMALFSFTHRAPEIKMTGTPPPAAEQLPGEPIFDTTEEMPVFPENAGNVLRWIMLQIAYPKEAVEQAFEGNVVAKFIIEKDGSVGNIEIVSSPAQSLSDEVVRVLKTSPKWTPGKNNGVPVRVRYHIPVNFSLQREKPAKMDEVKVIGYGSMSKSDSLRQMAWPTFRFQNIDNAESGEPLILLDDREITQERFNAIDPNTIKSISVLKDGTAIELYGDKGRNGVIIIESKGGKGTTRD